MKNSFTLLFIFLGLNSVFAQVGIGTPMPNPSTQLEVVAADKGILIPQVNLTGSTDVTSISNGNINSLLVYNTATISDVVPGYYYWDGAKWLRITTSDDSITDANTTNASLTQDGTNLVLTDSDGNTVQIALADLQNNTDDQQLSLDGTTNVLTLEDGGTVDLTPYLDNTDDQQITAFSLDGTTNILTITLEDGGTQTVDLTGLVGTDDQQLSLDGTTNVLTLEDGGTVDLTPYLDNTDDQQITAFSLDGTTNILTITLEDGGTQTVDLTGLVGTDDQQLSLDGTTNVLTLENGGTVDLTPYLDNTDDQQITDFSLDGTTNVLTITLEDGGTQTVDLTGLVGTDDQQLSLDGTTNVLTLEDGGTVDLTPYLDNTDDQQITAFSLDGTTNILTITLEDGGTQTVDLSSFVTDLRLVGTNNHITVDAGVGNNGTSAGTGQNNVAIGNNSLSSLTTGFDNIGIGFNTLSSVTTGSNSIALGWNALATYNPSASLGTSNIAIGNQSLRNHVDGSGNLGLGTLSLLTSTSGTGNTSVGLASLTNKGAGSDNTALGFRSGDNLTSGSNNIIIGALLDFNDPTGSNQLNIGNIIYGTSIDGTATTVSTGNIGIGEIAPTDKLDVSGTLRVQNLPATDTNDVIVMADETTGQLRQASATTLVAEPWFGVNGTPLNTTDDTGATTNTEDIYHLGNVGIGSIPTSAALTVGTDNGEDVVITRFQNTPIDDDVDLDFIKGYGTKTAPAPITNTGVRLGGVRFRSFVNPALLGSNILAAIAPSAEIAAETDGVPSTTSAPGKLIFQTTPVGSINTQTRMIINNAGDLQLNSYPNTRDDSSITMVSNILYTDATGNILSAPATTFDSDLRLVGTNNHITQDAGLGSNGTDAGTGMHNIGIGNGALTGITTASNNIAIGFNSLSTIEDDEGSIGIGSNTLAVFRRSSSSAFSSTYGNVAIGNSSLSNHTIGGGNTSLGTRSLMNSIRGFNNTAMGTGSLFNKAGGNNNTALGFFSGDNLTRGSGNIIIGANLDFNDPTGNGQLNIGNLIYGTGLNGTGTIVSTGNIGVGTASPTEKLEVNGKIKAVDVNFSGLPTFDDEAAAIAGGLTTGDMYKTTTGELRIKL